MAAEQWVTTNDAMLEGLNQVDRKMTLSFESFVANPVEKTNQILEFLGVSGPEVSISEGAMRVGAEQFTVRNPNTASLDRLGDRKSEIDSIVEPMMATLTNISGVKKTTHKFSV